MIPNFLKYQGNFLYILSSTSIFTLLIFLWHINNNYLPTSDAINDFVSSFQAEYNRLPSLYASQGYDTGKLLISALSKSSLSDKDAFRGALKNADFSSTRGKFKFASNQHPIQDIYVREVIIEGDVLTNKIISVGLKDRSNAYVDDCKLN